MADDGPIIIDLGADSGQTAAFDSVIDSLKAITDEWRDLTQAVRDATTGMGQFATTARASRAIVRAPSGPMSRFNAAQNQLAQARAGGDPNQIFDAQYRVLQAQTSLTRAQNRVSGNVAPAWAQAIMSSRFSLGGGGGGGMSVMPLVGRSLAALGKVAGPLAIAFAAVALGVREFNKALHSVRETLRDGGKGFWASGGSSSFGVASGIGAILGMSGAQTGGMARSLGDRINSDPVARAYAARAGMDLTANNAFGGSQDNAKQLVQAANEIRRLSQADAVRFARGTGTEDLLGLRDVSEGTFREAKSMFVSLASPEFRRASAEFDARLALLGGEFKKILVEVIGPMIPNLTRMLAVGRQLINFFRGLHSAISEFIKRVLNLIPKPFWDALDTAGGAFGGGTGRRGLSPGSRTAEELLNRNTDALDRNTRAIDDLTRQIFGGGQRARRAIPAGWAHHSVRDAAQGAAIGLGAFSL